MTTSSNDIAGIDELKRQLESAAAENARLRSELAIARDRQNASTEILRTIANSSGDAEGSLQQIAEATMHLFGAPSATIHIAEGDGWSKVIRVGDSSRRVGAGVPLAQLKIGGRNMPGTIVAESRQVHVPDLDNVDPAIADWPGLPHVRAAGTRSMSGSPLRLEGKAIGALIVYRDRLAPFTDDEMALQQSFADQAAIAIENARLFNETRESLERQTATADILKVLASSPSDMHPVFDAIAANANRLIGGFSTAVLRYIDGAAHLAAFTPTEPAGDRVLQASFPVPFARFPAYQLVADGTATQLHDTELEPAARDIARARGFRSMLFAPLMSEGDAIGVIIVTRSTTGAFGEHHVRLLQTFADQAVIAIKNVSLFNAVQARTMELAKSLDDLRAAQDRLIQTEKLASLGQLTAGIAHEIKNPLNFVNNFAALSSELTDELNKALAPVPLADDVRAEVDELTGLLKDNLGKVVQHGRRADSIVKNMLLHSREGTGEHRLTDINALVEESLDLAYHGARAEKPQFDVTVKRELDPKAGTAELFPQEITRVLLNLISNGFYALARRGNGGGVDPMLSATTRDRGTEVEIRIRDNGTGIPPDVKEKMFNPFFTTKPAGEGTGLGLSLSHDIIVKQHGGTIDVDTRPGEFTEFTILLPRKSGFIDKG